MKSPIPKLVLSLAVAATLAASLPSLAAPPQIEGRLLEQVHAGLSQDEVRSDAGDPAMTLRSSDGSAVWVYFFVDEWGYQSEFDVTFGADGVATNTDSERNF